MNVEESQTFQELFYRYYPSLLAYARGIVGSSDAEDVIEDVFADLWSHRKTIVFGERIGVFLHRSTMSHALNHLRHKNVSRRYVQMMQQISERNELFIETQLLNSDNDDWEQMYQLARQAIEELPEKCREVFKLSYIYGMKNKEISELKNISVKTVEAHLYYALAVLRKRFKGLPTVFLFLLLSFSDSNPSLLETL